MATRRSFSTAAVPTTLSADITNAAVTLSVADGSTYVDGTSGPSVLTINRGKSNEERILYTTRVGNTFSGLTRGYNGTAAQAHTQGEPVEHTSTQQDFDEANSHVADTIQHGYHGVACSLSVTTVVAVDNTISVVAWDTEDYDTDAYHSNSVNASRLIVPAGMGGKYRVWGIAEFGASAVGHRSMDTRVNGSTVHVLAVAGSPVSSDGVPTLNGAITLALAAGDYVELRVIQDSGGNLTFNANGHTRFGMDFLG